MKYGQRIGGERKKDIIHGIAAQILCDLGYEKASIRDIAEATGMTKAGLYYYFDTKEELLFQILDSFMDDLLGKTRDLHEQISDPADLIQAMINLQVQMYCQDKYRARLIVHDENCLSGELHKRLKEKQREYFSFWKKALDRFFEHNGICVDHVAVDAHFLMGACIWIQQWYRPNGEVTPEQLVKRFFSTFLCGLANRKTMAPEQAHSTSDACTCQPLLEQ